MLSREELDQLIPRRSFGTERKEHELEKGFHTLLLHMLLNYRGPDI